MSILGKLFKKDHAETPSPPLGYRKVYPEKCCVVWMRRRPLLQNRMAAALAVIGRLLVKRSIVEVQDDVLAFVSDNV